MSTEQGYSWDQPTIEKPKEDGEYTLLPPGEYRFTVLKFDRARHEGSAKLPPCNKAVIYIKVDGMEHGEVVLKNNMFLHPKCEGLICQFGAAIGQRNHGEPLNIPALFADMIGRGGTVKIKHRTKDDKVYNDIDRFLDPPTNGTATAPTSAPAPEAVDEDLPF